MANLQDRDGFERKFATLLGRLSAKHRRELAALLGAPPDVANVPASFWERVRRETEEELLAMLLLIYIASATQHGLGSERASTLGLTWAASRASEVARGYSEHSRDRTNTAGREWREQTDRGDAPSKAAVGDRLVSVFGPSRVEGIAVSETTNAVSAGGEAAVEELVGIDELDTWFTEGDGKVCPICRPLHGKKRGVWSRKFPSGPGAHPGCRCWIHYANEKRGAAAIAR